MTTVHADPQPSSEVAGIREAIDHPIIDGDGHFIEFMPMVRDIVRDLAGEGAIEALRSRNIQRGYEGYLPARAYWGIPAGNTLDRMTAMMPELLYRRLDEFGIDFAILYPTGGLTIPSILEPELRQAACRAFNIYSAQVFADYKDRLSPVATIPTFTPEEAIAELDYAVGTLGLKGAMLSGVIPRRRVEHGQEVAWIDTLGHDSEYDYDPLWQRCEELGISPAFHGIGYAWGTRASRTNYVYNHIGNFASAQESVCRSLLMGGVPHRFPKMHFQFLEGGVSWAAQLLADTIGHYEKRNGDAITALDPAAFDLDRGTALFDQYQGGPLQGRLDDFVAEAQAWMATTEPNTDDFAESGITGIGDIVAIFRDQFSFGCEADDPLNALAFDQRVLPKGGKLNALFASDIGHWDVQDMSDVLCEAWELVEDGHIDKAAFRDFTFTGVAKAVTATNPDFFKGTVVESQVASALGR
jgi:predicted TIM-barrel fold metal-dependent hydrolase